MNELIRVSWFESFNYLIRKVEENKSELLRASFNSMIEFQFTELCKQK